MSVYCQANRTINRMRSLITRTTSSHAATPDPCRSSSARTPAAFTEGSLLQLADVAEFPRNAGMSASYGDEVLAETRRNGLEGRIDCLGLIDRQKQIQLLRASTASVCSATMI